MMNLIERLRRHWHPWHRMRYGTPYEWGKSDADAGLLSPGYYSFDGGHTWHEYSSTGEALHAYTEFLTARRIEASDDD